jgi:hypothetical protein
VHTLTRPLGRGLGEEGEGDPNFGNVGVTRDDGEVRRR